MASGAGPDPGRAGLQGPQLVAGCRQLGASLGLRSSSRPAGQCSRSRFWSQLPGPHVCIEAVTFTFLQVPTNIQRLLRDKLPRAWEEN